MTHEWSLAGRPAAEWIARLTWQPPLRLFAMFRVALVLAIASPWLLARRDRLWSVMVAACVLFYWFGSATGDSYLPLPLWRRMLPPHPRVWLIAQLIRAHGAAGKVASRADALGLRRVVRQSEIRLYDAGDGARLRDALARPPLSPPR